MRAAFAVGAKRRRRVIEDSVALFENEDVVLPGIGAVASPGHASFEPPSGRDNALILGNAIGNHHVAFHKPA
ncbi:hypothetical protein [Tateyamaria omphalii]|uniref:hypothetical protein n=1 Tax=Tateyamaria omphalii TaxID=299262 RepID=UPI0020C75198|nr:hypothetical protein [Tateyamaria omphalii]